MERRKLDTLLEKEAHQLTTNIKNHAQSFVYMYCRKKNLKIDEQVLSALGEIYNIAIEDGFQSQAGIFNRAVGKTIDQFLEEGGGDVSSKRKK